MKCCVENCNRDVPYRGARNMCHMHYTRWRRTGATDKKLYIKNCAIKNCNCAVVAKGLCNKHYARKTRNGHTNLLPKNKGKYVAMQDDFGNWTFEHILLAEKALGKRLPWGAQVHHVNGIKRDNTPSNLVVCPNQKYHALLHKRTKALGYFK